MKDILELISKSDIPDNLKVNENNKDFNKNKNNNLQTGGFEKTKYFIRSKNILPPNFMDK